MNVREISLRINKCKENWKENNICFISKVPENIQ